MIPKINLNPNSSIPIIGLGTYKNTGRQCYLTVKKAIELGYTHVDTAEYYNNEQWVGKAIKETNREEVFLTSKLWFTNFSYEKTMRSFNESLKKLSTNYLDLYLIHWPQKDKDLEPVLNAFHDLIQEGKIINVGVSNFTINHLKDLLPLAKKTRVRIVMNQVEFHPGLYQRELLDFCEKKEIRLTAYSPLGRGKLLTQPLLVDLGKKYKKTVPQIILNWINSKKVVSIPKARSEEHLKQNLNSLNFELEKNDVELIDALGNNNRFVQPWFNEFDY